MAQTQYDVADLTSMLTLGWMSDMNTNLPDVNFDEMPADWCQSMAGDEKFDMSSPAYTTSPPSWQSGAVEGFQSGYSTPQSAYQTSQPYAAQYAPQYTPQYAPRSQVPQRAATQPPSACAHAAKYEMEPCHAGFDESPFEPDIFDDIDWSGHCGETHDEDDNDLRCWDHGCNGRRFTTRSNLCRHKRENSAARPKYYCPRCGAVFSRAASRDVHLEKLSCNRIRRYSNGRERPPRRKHSSRRSQ